MLRTVALLGAVSAFLAGCATGSAPQPVRVEAPAQWASSGPAAAGVWPAPDWWRSFDSAELPALMASAQASNFDLGIAAARVVQADAQARIAGAALLPTVDFGADVARQRSGSSSGRSGGAGGSSGSRWSTSSGASLNASYEVDFWGRNRADVDAARASAAASRYGQQTVALTVTADVATTYFQILALRDRLAVARENLAAAERVLGVVEARANAGAVSPLDLAQQRAAIAGQRAAIPPLQQQERQAVYALAILLGRNPEGFDVRSTTMRNIALPSVAPGMPSELLNRRPDIRAAEAQLAAANADIHAARAAFFPRVQLNSSANIASLAISTILDPAGAALGLAASLTQPIFEGGRLRGGLELAQGRREELVHGYRRAVASAFSDVEVALVSVERAAEEEAFVQEQVTQARRALELAELRYREGAVDLLAVLDAQRTLFQAEDRLTQIRLARLQSAVGLFRALGGGWEAPSRVARS